MVRIMLRSSNGMEMVRCALEAATGRPRRPHHQNCVKVATGKRHAQTADKGPTAPPLFPLGYNLLVARLPAILRNSDLFAMFQLWGEFPRTHHIRSFGDGGTGNAIAIFVSGSHAFKTTLCRLPEKDTQIRNSLGQWRPFLCGLPKRPMSQNLGRGMRAPHATHQEHRNDPLFSFG